MPRQSTATEIRFNTITACFTPALTPLNELDDAFGPLFVQPISNTILSLITTVLVIISEDRHLSNLLVIIEYETE
jgi:hypothetical protein